jgi:rRNA-processing protein EBP2
MVKTDAHMERIRQRLLDESSNIAKSEARRREREGKKVGKQVQLEKLKERERGKKDMEERLKGLKRSAFSLSVSSLSFIFELVL